MEFWLKEQSIKTKQNRGFTDGQYTLTYNQLYSAAYQLSKLLSLNESRVGLYIGNDIDSVILVHACWLAQIEIAMINTRLTTTEMTNQMNSVNVQLILTTKSSIYLHIKFSHLINSMIILIRLIINNLIFIVLHLLCLHQGRQDPKSSTSNI